MKTMKQIHLIITLSLVMIFQVSRAQDPVLDWVVQMGGQTLDNGRSVAIDQNGNVISTGSIGDNATWILYEGGVPVSTFELTSVGARNVFIQKVDPDGNHTWTKHCGGSGIASGQTVKTDPSGNIYVMGNFSGTVDFDPGPGIYNMTYTGNEYIETATYILKLDADGNFLWAKRTEPVSGGTSGYSMNRDAGGNLIITGNFGGRVDFDPGPGKSIHIGAYYLIFILKLDGSGNFLWANELGGNSNNYGYSVTTDAVGNIYATGAFYGTADFDPSKHGIFNMTSKGGHDIFIQKSNPEGNFLWAKQMGGTLSDAGQSMTTDAFGNLYTSGYFSGTVDFDPGPEIFEFTASTSTAFIQKLDAAGDFVWAVQLEGLGTEDHWSGTWSINTDAGGNVYTTGYFGGSADFDPGDGTYVMTCVDSVDCFALKLDPDGLFNWALQIGGDNGFNCGLGINTDLYGNVYTTGFFTDYATGFDPGNPDFELQSNGYRDYFLQKLNQGTGADCLPPLYLSATEITSNSATLNWNAVEGAGSYNIRYKDTSSENWTTNNNVSGTNLPIDALTQATDYEFQVQTDCGETQSVFSPSATFTTLEPGCPDVYEPNETMATAATIPVNTDITALINSANDLDWFTFITTNSAKNIKITLTNLPANYDVVLYKSNGDQIGISQNTGTTSETIIYNTNKAGTYYIKVYGAGGAFDPVNCYTLKAATSSPGFKSAEAESNNSDENDELTVYPNPSSSTFNFIYKTNSPEPITIQLFDLSGRLVQEYQSLPPNDMITAGETLEYGIYVAVMTQGTVKKIVKIAKVQ